MPREHPSIASPAQQTEALVRLANAEMHRVLVPLDAQLDTRSFTDDARALETNLAGRGPACGDAAAPTPEATCISWRSA